MMKYLAIAALGPDRPGLVAQVTSYLTDRGANVEDSRMAVLGGEWGMLILVSGDERQIDSVVLGFPALEKQTGLEIRATETESPEEHRRPTTMSYVVTAEAMDHEGIVRAISGALHRMGVNIVALATTTYNAPVTGSPLFRMEAMIDVPRELPVARLRKELDELAQRENVDLAVRSAAAGV